MLTKREWHNLPTVSYSHDASKNHEREEIPRFWRTIDDASVRVLERSG